MIRKILETIFALACALSLVLAGGENPDGSCNLWWTFSWLSLAVVFGLIFGMLRKRKPVHVTDEAYIELQRQIQEAVDRMGDETRKTIEVDAGLPGDGAIYLTIVMLADTSRTKFTDGAWGASQTFTETKWTCACKIAYAYVFDGKGRERESDFDETQLELEYETCQWD